MLVKLDVELPNPDQPVYFRSGGQKQSIAIARALYSEDLKLIILDEPTASLGPEETEKTLELVNKLRDRGYGVILISHNLSVVRHLADRVAVMYVGNIVEIAGTDDLFRRPLHPYTEALLFSAPFPDPRLRRERKPLKGGVADISNLPSGCPFHPRCPYALPVCQEVKPTLEPFEAGGRRIACHRARDLELQGLSGNTGATA